ncbi:hypothetical protein DUI87_07097 [Hirundo rustica rustica]|uniref:Uncharacterized protein n=1 Tax=Hirundo rustica rustica TaxID=333673 RepID=A0A3M0KVW6_HIRRU|nr:hypothetical protein DUI87_07097 [Hirundo rustica rustica]
MNSATTPCSLLKSEDDGELSAAGEPLEGGDAVQRELHRLEALNPMKFHKARCKVLHLGWGDPQYLCRVEDELRGGGGLRAGPEENLGMLDGLLDMSCHCAHAAQVARRALGCIQSLMGSRAMEGILLLCSALPELALQVFQLVSCEEVLPIKVVWNVYPGAPTYNSQRIPLAIAAHTGGTQSSLCSRTFPVLAACAPERISLIASSTGCFQSPGTSPDFHDFKDHGAWLGSYTS